MAAAENHTLRLLREIREGVKTLDAKVDKVHGDLKAGIDGLTQALAGGMAANRYAAGGIEQRFAEVERRLVALEQSR